jgi:hypothetical protein
VRQSLALKLLRDLRFISINGVPGGVVYSIAEDTGGNLWIAKV